MEWISQFFKPDRKSLDSDREFNNTIESIRDNVSEMIFGRIAIVEKMDFECDVGFSPRVSTSVTNKTKKHNPVTLSKLLCFMVRTCCEFMTDVHYDNVLYVLYKEENEKMVVPKEAGGGLETIEILQTVEPRLKIENVESVSTKSFISFVSDYDIYETLYYLSGSKRSETPAIYDEIVLMFQNLYKDFFIHDGKVTPSHLLLLKKMFPKDFALTGDNTPDKKTCLKRALTKLVIQNIIIDLYTTSFHLLGVLQSARSKYLRDVKTAPPNCNLFHYAYTNNNGENKDFFTSDSISSTIILAQTWRRTLKTSQRLLGVIKATTTPFINCRKLSHEEKESTALLDGTFYIGSSLKSLVEKTEELLTLINTLLEILTESSEIEYYSLFVRKIKDFPIVGQMILERIPNTSLKL